MSEERRRGWKIALFALWFLEWVYPWSGILGPMEGVVELLWWLGLGYFVIESRTGRLPPILHTWGWMSAVLGVSILRAWVIGVEGWRSPWSVRAPSSLQPPRASEYLPRAPSRTRSGRR